MEKDLAQKAVEAALKGNWEKAIELNKKIIKATPKDTDALNRLARAHAELGDLPKAKKNSAKVLKIDPFNKIAQKCLDKWKGLKKGETIRSASSSASAFIEEPGKTKIVPLLHVGSEKITAKLDSGDEVKLNPHGHRVSVITQEGKYIGRLPDDIGAKLKKLMKLGNTYKVLIKSTNMSEVKVFIREIKSNPKLKDIPSFSNEKIDYISFTPPGLVHKKESVYLIEDDAEE
jgi:tetratricopeptide (TPR) repeat protein